MVILSGPRMVVVEVVDAVHYVAARLYSLHRIRLDPICFDQSSMKFDKSERDIRVSVQRLMIPHQCNNYNIKLPPNAF